MLRKNWKFILSLLAVFSLVFAFSACSGGVSTNLPEPDYAGSMVENLLIALNNGDFNQFSQNLDSDMQKSITQEVFNTQFIQGIKGKIGDYEAGSKRFFSCSKQAQFTTVIYMATYTNEPGAVLVQISFQPVNGTPLISGIFYNSPKLRS